MLAELSGGQVAPASRGIGEFEHTLPSWSELSSGRTAQTLPVEPLGSDGFSPRA